VYCYGKVYSVGEKLVIGENEYKIKSSVIFVDNTADVYKRVEGLIVVISFHFANNREA
jgi:hypothetical protein